MFLIFNFLNVNFIVFVKQILFISAFLYIFVFLSLVLSSFESSIQTSSGKKILLVNFVRFYIEYFHWADFEYRSPHRLSTYMPNL